MSKSWILSTINLTAQVLVNKARGDAFRDEVAQLLIKGGREVKTEVVKQTRLGTSTLRLKFTYN